MNKNINWVYIFTERKFSNKISLGIWSKLFKLYVKKSSDVYFKRGSI